MGRGYLVSHAIIGAGATTTENLVMLT